jgi:HlyD family secretion protein
VVVAALAAGGYWFFAHPGSAGAAQNALTYTVVPMDMEIKISREGELQAVNNIEVQCMVEGQTTVQTLVAEGSLVKKGDVLAVLDSTEIKKQIDETQMNLDTVKARVVTAVELLEIQKLTNAANLEAAQSELDLAKLDYEKYVKGTYPADVESATNTVKMAEITLKNRQEDLKQKQDLANKGFVNMTDVKTADLERLTAEQALNKAVADQNVLIKYSHQADSAKLKNAVSQAEQKLTRTKSENASNLAQKMSDVTAQNAALAAWQRRMDHWQEQFAYCTIKAPANGILVYATSQDRNSDAPLQAGTSVRERQVLFTLPDMSAMKATIRVPESQVGRLKEGMRATLAMVGRSKPIGATLTRISLLADNSNRYWNPDARDYPVELTLDETPPGLKPGMRVTAEVFIDKLTNVTAVPAAAVYSSGADHYVFVKRGESVKPVKVQLGEINETHVVVKGAVGNNADVVILQAGQGRALLEDSGTAAQANPTQQANAQTQPPVGA